MLDENTPEIPSLQVSTEPNIEEIAPVEVEKKNNNPQFSRLGCISAVILVALGTLICSNGNRWLFEPSTIFGESYGETFASTLASGGTQVIILLIVSLSMIFLRAKRFKLLRGIGAGNLIAAAYTFTNSVLIGRDAILPYPGIPDFYPPLILIVIAIVLILIFGRGALASARRTALLGIGIGLLVTSPWAFTGALGELSDMAVAIADSLAFGLWLGLATSMLFYFDGEEQERHLLWSMFAAAGFAGALLPTFLAGRGGYVLSIAVLTPLIAILPIVPMLILWPHGMKSTNRWLPTAALASSFLLVPLLFFEGIEIEFMPEVGVKMAAGIFFVFLAALTVAAVWFVVWMIWGKFDEMWRIWAIIIPAVAIITAGIVTTQGTWWQPDTIFVVMADQADIEFVTALEARDERVSVAYENLVEHATTDQQDIRQWLDGRSATYTPFYLINGLEVEATPLMRRQLSQRDDVGWILESPQARPLRNWFEPATDLSMTGLTPPEEAPGDPVWGILEVNAPLVWDEFNSRGEGIIVGSADSGVDFTHPALVNQYLGSADNHDYAWFDPGLKSPAPADSGGHGTHTTGTILGDFGIGVAPAAQWIGCRNLPRNLGNPADYVACMEFLFAPFPIGGDPFTDGDPTRGAHLTNNSWGCPPEEGCDGRTMGIAIRQLRLAGQLMVISNGNSGPACDTTGVPATNDDAFSVGALSSSGTMAGFSSRGPAVDYDGDLIIKPDIVAPGVEIISSLPGNTYGPSQGTSMAGPHVAGVVALLWSAVPELIGDIDQTEQILVESANQIQLEERCLDNQADPEINTDTGHGVIDAYAAVQLAREQLLGR
ncbi:MAG: S8 family serine peptidase [Chloroflexota bacterium]